MDIEETTGMKIMKEVEVGLEKGRIQIISEGMIGVAVIVDQGQDQQRVLTERGLGVISVENMIIFEKDSPTMARDERQTEQIQQMFNLDKEQTALKTLAADTYDSLNCVSSLEYLNL